MPKLSLVEIVGGRLILKVMFVPVIARVFFSCVTSARTPFFTTLTTSLLLLYEPVSLDIESSCNRIDLALLLLVWVLFSEALFVPPYFLLLVASQCLKFTAPVNENDQGE